MKLLITRDQDKGLMGGISFFLKAQVELTNEEQELVKKYKAHKEILLSKNIQALGNTLTLNIKIGGLIEGESFKCKDISEILTTEANLKEACQNFKNYLEVMKGFGGQEIIQYI